MPNPQITVAVTGVQPRGCGRLKIRVSALSGSSLLNNSGSKCGCLGGKSESVREGELYLSNELRLGPRATGALKGLSDGA